jgi:hypothetical protein
MLAVAGPSVSADPGAGAGRAAAAHTVTDALAVPAGLGAGDPAIPLADLPGDAARPFAGAAMVDVGGGCSGVLVRPTTDADPGAPAYVLTNGHCIELLDPTEVRRDTSIEGSVSFGWPGGPLHETAEVASVRWASMKGTDLAVLELRRTLSDLLAAGVPAYLIASTTPEPGTRVAIVGAPAPDDGSDRQLRLAVCSLLDPVDLVEETWWWHGFPRDDCAGIRHGSSGSPVLDLATGRLVGLVNTGTEGSEGRSDCMFDRPCEVTAGSARSREDAVYGPSVAGLGACWGADGRWVGPGGACPLDPGIGLRVEGAVDVTNPDSIRPDGRPSRTSWGARLSADDPLLRWYRIKTGPLGVVDCRDAAGYGPPMLLRAAPLYDEPVPGAEGRYQLCLLAGPGPVPDAGWQEPRFASVVTAWVDRTPPIPAADFAATSTEDGWVVDPIVVPPELTSYTWKAGPEASTDCADPEGFRTWRHAPIRLTVDGPARICLIGHDPAGNPSPTIDAVLPDGPPAGFPSPPAAPRSPAASSPPRLPNPAV